VLFYINNVSFINFIPLLPNEKQNLDSIVLILRVIVIYYFVFI